MHPMTERPLGGLFQRFLAVLIDGLIAAVISIPSVVVSVVIQQTGPTETMTALATFVGLLTLVAMLCYVALLLAMWTRGLSPGKWLLGLRVIYGETSLPASFWRMALREIIGKWVSGVVCYLGYIWALFDARKQGWHDKIAGTLVVSTR